MAGKSAMNFNRQSIVCNDWEQVADGWAGAEMRVFTLSNSITMTDGPTDRRTNGRTDRVSYRGTILEKVENVNGTMIWDTRI